MIARTWHCVAAGDENVTAYVHHFENTVLPELKQLAGFLDFYILRRSVDAGIQITVITLWESMQSIRAFAGDNIERAVVEPAAQAVLQFFDPTVTHSQVILKSGN
jgi:heme-degrading monooxygenase HmoA